MSRLIERVRFGGHGQGSLAKFSDGPNWISIYCARGKEHRESTGTPDLKLARRFHRRKLDELAAARQGLKKFLAPLQQRVTVSELLDDWQADIALRGLKSARKLRYHSKPVRVHFGPMRAADVTAATVDRYVSGVLTAGKSNGTANRQTQILGAAFRLAVERGKVIAAPKFRKLRESNIRRIFYTQDEAAAVLAAAPDYLQDALRFFHATGWRKSEVVGLTWSMVDLAAGLITLPTSKNNRGRVLALAGDLVEIMKRREQARLVERPDGEVAVSDFVFHHRGRCLGDFKRSWHATLERAGLSHQERDPATGVVRTVYDRTIHDFRRTAVRNLIRSGVRETVAMGVSGHKSRSVFDRYNITSTDDLREALERVQTSASARAES
jgi:integrase